MRKWAGDSEDRGGRCWWLTLMPSSGVEGVGWGPRETGGSDSPWWSRRGSGSCSAPPRGSRRGGWWCGAWWTAAGTAGPAEGCPGTSGHAASVGGRSRPRYVTKTKNVAASAIFTFTSRAKKSGASTANKTFIAPIKTKLRHELYQNTPVSLRIFCLPWQITRHPRLLSVQSGTFSAARAQVLGGFCVLLRAVIQLTW